MSRVPEERLDLDAELSVRSIREGLDRLSRLKVVVIGETIIDEYAYCDVIGKSGKEPMLVTGFSHCETQAGGVLAIANHLAEFCEDVRIVSALGDHERRESFVRTSLRPEVHARFVTKPHSPTIVKRRYLDAYSQAKILGVYQINTSAMPDSSDLRREIDEACKDADLIIVADYGHGFITADTAQYISEQKPFLALNTQLNAANHGYHVLSKFPRADYICVHEGELRLEARDRHGPIETILEQTLLKLASQSILVTLGKRGTLHYARGGSMHRCPALATKVVERVGAGDAVLAISSVASAVGLSPAEVSFLSNLAGAQLVSVVGNSASIRKSDMLMRAAELLPHAKLHINNMQQHAVR